MPEQTVAAASSAEVDVFKGEQPSMAEFSHYRETGELPERFKPAEDADPAPADAPKQTVVATEGDEPESEPEPEPDEAQEQPPKGSGAEKRIKQLLAEKKELQRKLEATAKPDVKPDPSTAQTAAPQPQYTRPKPTAEDMQDGKPKYATYEDFVEELADWKAEQRMVAAQREQVNQEQRKALQTKLDDARSRYEDADEVIFPAAQTINDARIPQAVKEVFADSDVFPDLCYVVGSDPDELKKFISLAQSNPRAALAKVFEYERGIREELAKTGKEAAEPNGGKAPERKQTTAPKPPSPVNGGSSRGAFDVNDESLSADDWFKKRNHQIERQKG